MKRSVLYYAMGGGLGHLTRARAVLHTLGLEGRAILMTASPFGTDSRVVGEVPVLVVPPELDGNARAFRLWLDGQLTTIRPESLIVDTFPAGILGELTGLAPRADMRLLHVARRLRWGRYAEMLGPVALEMETSWLLEPLEPPHAAYLRAHSARVARLELVDPPAPPITPAANAFWLVVHSGPTEEVTQLLLYAAEMQRIEGCETPIFLASPVEPAAVGVPFRPISAWPASGWFAAASRVISGCGFNVMRQMEPWREKHRFLPFPRRLDDQFARAAEARSGARPS